MNNIIITGMHRSGTTVLGDLIAKAYDIDYLHEPFNADFGCDAISKSYPKVERNNKGEELKYLELLNHIFSLRFKCHKTSATDGWIKTMLRPVTGGKCGMNRMRLALKEFFGLRKRKSALLLKDPFLVGLSPLLIKKFDAKVIITIRHPAAIWRSVQRMGWKFEFDSLDRTRLAELCADFGLSEEQLLQMKEVEKIAYLWLSIYRDVTDLSEHYKECLIIVKHEDFCILTEETANRCADFLGQSRKEKLLELFTKFTSGGKVNAPGKKLHDFKRDSSKLAWSWVGKIDANDCKIIRDITEEKVIELYGYWSPN